MTAIPLCIAFAMSSPRGERWAGYCIVAVIFASALLALVQVIDRFLNPQTPTHLWALLIAGIVGVVGNEMAASSAGGRADASTHLPSSPTGITPAPTATSAQASSSPRSPTRSSAFSSRH